MAIKANGALLEFRDYEFGLLAADGELTETGSFDVLRAIMHTDERIVFRATYATEWIEVTDEFS
jgi:hypothetical protein